MRKYFVLGLLFLVVSGIVYMDVRSYRCDHIGCQLATAMPHLANLQVMVEKAVRENDSQILSELNQWEGLSDASITAQGVVSFSLKSTYVVTAVPTLNSTGDVNWKCDIFPQLERSVDLELLLDCGKLFRK